MSRSALDTAFTNVYQAHFRFAWRILWRLGVREADLMDLTQAVFVVVYTKLPKFERRSAITTWIFEICRRSASQYFRSAWFRREVPTGARVIGCNPAPPEGSPESIATQNDLGERALAILNMLPESQREVFVLFEVQELSGSQIAELLGISLGTVRSRLRLARATVRRQSQGQPPAMDDPLRLADSACRASPVLRKRVDSPRDVATRPQVKLETWKRGAAVNAEAVA
jgi:RNA polymerase sigma-70 factor (ECF subfamily)